MKKNTTNRYTVQFINFLHFIKTMHFWNFLLFVFPNTSKIYFRHIDLLLLSSGISFSSLHIRTARSLCSPDLYMHRAPIQVSVILSQRGWGKGWGWLILAAALRARNRIQIGASSSATCEAARTHLAHTHTTLLLTANQFIARVDFSQRAPRLNLVRHTRQSLNGKESAPLVTFETLFTVAWPTFGRRVVLRADAGKHAPFCTTLAMNHSAEASQRAVERNTISDAPATHINSALGHSRSFFAAALLWN